MVWKRMPLAALVVLAALLAAIGLLDPGRAHGDLPRQANVTVSRKVDHGGQGELSSFRLDAGTTGNIAFCAQGYLIGPREGQTLTRHGDPGIPELDYVLYHGYDGEVVTSLDGLSAERSEHATALAVWLAIADQRADLLTFQGTRSSFHGNRFFLERWESRSDAEVKKAAWDLYQAGLDYKAAGGGGVEAGCTTLWLNNTKGATSGTADFQALVTVSKRVKVTFAKSSAQPKTTAGNSSYSLEGAAYDVYRADDDTKVASFTTDAKGTASVDLAPGTSYYAVETAAPKGYLPHKGRIPFKAGGPGPINLKDEPGTVTLTIGKRDAATKAGPQRGASLKGAEFRVTSASTPGWETTVKTDAHGTAKVTGIPLGTIHVVETKAPLGYRIDPTVRSYTVGSEHLTDAGVVELIPEGDFLEHPIAFDLEIAKFLNGTGQSSSGLEPAGEGIAFEIVSRSSNEVIGRIVTGADGHATTKGLWFGDGERVEGIKGALPYDKKGYLVREVEGTAPSGYQPADDWGVPADQMADGATLRYIVNNTAVTSHLQIVKTDAKSGRVVPLPGFTFQILDQKGQPISQENWYPEHVELSEFTTDQSGTVTLPERLPAGSYFLHEVAAAAPYLLRGEDLPFEVGEDASSPLVTIEVPNTQATGEATLTKTCASDGRPLAGAVYDVVSYDDLTAPDGTVQAVSGQIMGHVTTDEQGVARISDLPLGAGTARYAFIEVTPPKGHAADATPVPFTLTYRDSATAQVSAVAEAHDEPTDLTVLKRVKGTEDPLPGAVFQLWDTANELGLKPSGGYGAVAIRLLENHRRADVTLVDAEQRPWISVEADGGFEFTASREDGPEIDLSSGTFVDPGTYTLRALPRHGGEGTLERAVELLPDSTYRVSVAVGLFGRSIEIEREDPRERTHELSFDEDQQAHISLEMPSGTYTVEVDGEAAGTLRIEAGSTAYGLEDKEGVRDVPILLKPDADPVLGTTDEEGKITFDHLSPGIHMLKEVSAPAGYIADGQTHELTVDDQGRIDGEAHATLIVENDFTKVEITKRDITNEEEIEGAELTIEDAKGQTVASWTSGAEPHRIDALPVGTYTLTERVSPRTHDLASFVTFTVEETGKIQPVTLYDAPLSITGQIDKRQEIADPTAKGMKAGSGNRARVSSSPEGLFEYSLDFRNTSGTWTDEFTVDDELMSAQEGLARLVSVTVPRAEGDFNGKLNLWYRTNRAADAGAVVQANATRDDGHDNPWLEHASTKQTLGEDARALEYRGWQLWEKDLDAADGRTLFVADLNLAPGEHVVAVRFEYGRVEAGFTSRERGWDRKDLKHAHDDVDSVPAPSEGSATGSPAVLRMQVTDAYVEGTRLENRAQVNLYRNGGGPKLEDHDEDRVTQSPVSSARPLAQTGALSPLPSLGASIAAGIGGGSWFVHRQRRRLKALNFGSLRRPAAKRPSAKR
ncbi:MAG: hypothetical protein E7001_03360 [Coriobacteriaceae bacterium]|nr:hypothetical protein [Coriobacteriaceae bacterium]